MSEWARTQWYVLIGYVNYGIKKGGGVFDMWILVVSLRRRKCPNGG